MSYNIDNVDTLVFDASMNARDIVRLVDSSNERDNWPESCFLDEHYNEAVKLVNARKQCECKTENDSDASFCKRCGNALPAQDAMSLLVELENLWWAGEGSGRSWDTLVNEVAPLIKGEVEAVFTWEGGDSTTGLAIKNGKVAKCNVAMTLEKPKNW